ncbi:LysR substrate-binding domain-containing protein, partial [Burkholderia gladioli]|nr:LysR substrate-binding domain-containing protein [Burkholderia gladioli]
SPAIRTLKDLPGARDLKTVVFQFGCSYRQRLDAFLAGLGIVVARPLEFGSLDAIVNCVSAGVGITLLPKGVVADAVTAGDVAIHRLPRELAMVETLFVRREDSYVSSAMTAFLELARRVYRQSRTGVPVRGRRGAQEPTVAA